MQPKTFFGLILIIAAGGALAWLFRAGGEPSAVAVAGADAPPPVATSNASRGRIVPLPVSEGFSGTAFIAGGESEPIAQPRREADSLLAVQPTIRRKPSADAASAPRLSEGFPPPLGLLGIGMATGEANLQRVDQSETPLSRLPDRHKIVDGDTLPALAERYLGDENRAAEIYELNRDRLPSIELLPIGLEIAIGQP